MLALRPLRHSSPKRKRPKKDAPVTVCIAALAQDGDAVVCCADTQISNQISSHDPLVGKVSMRDGWMVLTAGTMSQTEGLLAAWRKQHLKDNEPETIFGGLEKAVGSELARFVAARYLAPYGLNMEKFLSHGHKSFTDVRRNELSRQMAEYADDYDAELIFAGWGDKAEKAESGPAHIFSVNRDGVSRHADYGFHVTGSGATLASATLQQLDYRRSMNLTEVLYRVVAAKTVAERAPGIGERTMLWVSTRQRDKHGKHGGVIVQPHEIDELKVLWYKRGAPSVGSEIEGKVIEIVKSLFPKGTGVPMSVAGAVAHMQSKMAKAKRATQRSTSRKSKDQQ